MNRIIGFISSPSDPRCPITELSLKKFEKLGLEVHCESGLGTKLGRTFPKEDSRQQILQSADILYTPSPLSTEENKMLKDGASIISFYAPYEGKFDEMAFAKKDLRAFSMDMIPRTTLAQNMDVLSSMASIAGYQAVLLAAQKLPRYFPMMMTAAGTVRPAQVLILGAGVAGLQAIATSRRLGAKVEAFDVRAAVREEVQSLGAKFVEVQGAKDDSAAGGYAVQQTEEYKQLQKEAIARSVEKADVVISTAQLRGRPAPTLITEDMVKSMRYGSVIVDLAASTGGNCECTEDASEVMKHGICVIGDSELYLKTLQDASDLLANNLANFTALFMKEGELFYDDSNEIIVKSQVYPIAK